MSNAEIASLPTGWEACCFGDIAKIRNGYAFKSELFKKSKEHETDVPLIRQSQMKGTQIDTSEAVFLSGEYLKKHPDFVIEKGDVIIGMSGSIGKVCLYNEDFPALQNQRTGKIVPHLVSELNPKFFGLFLSNIERKLTEYAKGMGVQNISAKDIEQQPFNLPPKNEQHRIVAKIEELFSELDKGVENLKIARAQLKVYRQALLKHAFEGKLTAQWRADNQDKLETAGALLKRIQTERAQRYQQQLADWQANGGSKPKAQKRLPPLTAEELAELPELPEGWSWVRVGEIADVQLGRQRSPNNRSNNFPTKYIRAGNLTDSGLNLEDVLDMEFEPQERARFLLKAGDVLLSEASGSANQVGKPAVWRGEIEECCFQNTVIRVRSLDELSEYLFWVFKTYYISGVFSKLSGGVGINHLSAGKLENMAIPLVAMFESEKILELINEKLSLIENLDQTITTSLQQAEALRQSILKKAFSGQLVEQDANDEPASVLLARIKAEKTAQVATAKPRKLQKAKVRSVPIQTNLVPFPVKIANISATDLHAGIIALAYQRHEQSPEFLKYFHHVKAEKIIHLVEAHLGIDLERMPIKDAAGPNDFSRLKRKVEPRAKIVNWFDVRQEKPGGMHIYHKMPKFDELISKTRIALGERLTEVDTLIGMFLKWRTEHAEVIATLYAAWNNLLLLGLSPSDEEIVYEARENWHEAKLKIEREKFFMALEWMHNHGLVPVGRGRFVAKKGEQSKPGEVKHD